RADAGVGLPPFPGVAACPRDEGSVQDEPAADATSSAIEVDDIAMLTCGAEQLLGASTQRSVVVDDDGCVERCRQRRADVLIAPAQVRGEPDDAIGCPHEPG